MSDISKIENNNEPYLLEMKGISVSFQLAKALDNVDFQLKPGEVHALMGENGAGKSTLVKALTGIYRKESGRIYIDGKRVRIHSVGNARKHGIAVINQELALVNDMTVAENIFLGRESSFFGFINKRKMIEEAQRLVDEYKINVDVSEKIKNIPIAKQQMIEIVRAISLNTRILIMDEPTSSISDEEVAFLFEIIRKLKKSGVGIIYISHKISEIFEICDRVTVLCDGRNVGTEPIELLSKDKLIEMMIGRTLESYYPRDFGNEKDLALKCENVSYGNSVYNANFEVHHGEIVGFAGLVGSGRSQLMKCIFGLNKFSTGRIYVDGEEVSISSSIEAMNRKIAMVTENRDDDGLYKLQGTKYNTTIEILGEFINGIYVNSKKENEITQKYVDMFETKTSSFDQSIQTMSGGNQQKVLISHWLATKPNILILDEPTRGIDIGAKAQIYSIMNTLAKQGMAIIMVSSELSEILNMCDRIYVMRQGEITGELSHNEATQERIMQLAAN